MSENNILIKNNIYCLKQISSDWSDKVILYISNDKFGESGQQMQGAVDIGTDTIYTLCELIVYDWDKYLTPWPADIGMNGRGFQGNGHELLESVEDEIVPKIKQYTNISKFYIAGYSLAGLFSLWCLYESSMFDGAVSGSGSVWYPGWKEYISEHTLKKNNCVYLSLGKREKSTKNLAMRRVEENMNLQYQLLQKDNHIEKVVIEWNEGGHFAGASDRVAKGIANILG